MKQESSKVHVEFERRIVCYKTSIIIAGIFIFCGAYDAAVSERGKIVDTVEYCDFKNYFH